MRNIFYRILSWFTIPFIGFSKKKLRVLAYHTVNDEVSFEKQLIYISKNFNVISSDDLKQHLLQNKALPEKALLITFDDGDISVLEKGLPVLKKYNLPAVLFVITELINTSKPFWWYEMEQLLDKKTADSKVWEVKKMTNTERLAYMDEIRSLSESQIKQRQLTTKELKLLHSSNITVANHSHTHPMFDKSTVEELESEMNMAHDYLKENGFAYEMFAYPNGNYDLTAEKVLSEKGIEYAFLFDHLINDRKINPLRISRIRVNAEDNLYEFKAKVSGLHSLIMNLTK